MTSRTGASHLIKKNNSIKKKVKKILKELSFNCSFLLFLFEFIEMLADATEPRGGRVLKNLTLLAYILAILIV